MVDRERPKALKEGQQILLLDENVETRMLVKVFGDYSEDGMYLPGSGKLRHIIVAAVGYDDDWSAYEGYAARDDDDDIVRRAVRRWGDVIDRSRAEAYAYIKCPALVERRYRY